MKYIEQKTTDLKLEGSMTAIIGFLFLENTF